MILTTIKKYLTLGLVLGAFGAGFLTCKGLTSWGAVRQAEQGAVAVERVAKSKATIGAKHAETDKFTSKIIGDCDNRNTSAAINKLVPY